MECFIEKKVKREIFPKAKCNDCLRWTSWKSLEDNDDSVKNEERFNYALVRRTQDGYLTLDLQYGMCQLSKDFTTSWILRQWSGRKRYIRLFSFKHGHIDILLGWEHHSRGGRRRITAFKSHIGNFMIDAYLEYWKSYGHGRSTRKEEHRRTSQQLLMSQPCLDY